MPAVDELALRGDLTRGGVDEEQRHRRRRIALAPAPPGREALALFDADLRRRGAAETHPPRLRRRPRASSRRGRPPQGSSRPQVDPADAAPLRRLAVRAGATSPRPSPASSPRCARSSGRCASTATSPQNPADLVCRAQAPVEAAARAQGPTRSPRLLDRIPASTPLELRDRAMFELAYACGPARRGAREPRRRLGRLRRRGGARRGQGLARRGSSRSASRRSGAWRATSSAGAPSLRRRPTAEPALLPVEVRPAPVDLRRPPPPARLGPLRRPAGRRLAARAAPLVRHPPARRRRRPAGDPGAARPRFDQHDADLHSGRVRAAEVGLRPEPSRAP